MASYTTLVNVDSETALKVSTFIAKLIPSDGEVFLEECKVIISARDTSALINKLLTKQDLIIALENETGTNLNF